MGSSSTRINCKFGVLHCLSGETVITDHVRSIVRECLQEADVEWISSQKSNINGNYYEKGCKEDEQALDDRDDRVCEEMVTQEVGIIVSLLKIVLRVIDFFGRQVTLALLVQSLTALRLMNALQLGVNP